MVIYYDIEGVDRQRVTFDTTSEEISIALGGHVNNVDDVWRDVYDGATPTVADYNKLLTAIGGMEFLAQGNFVVPDDDQRHLINFSMAQQTDILLKSFAAVGMKDAVSDQQKINAVANWVELITGDDNVIMEPVDPNEDESVSNPIVSKNLTLEAVKYAAGSFRSIQAMIELEYVREGNNLINDKLVGLETALSSTQSAVQILTEIQNLYNQVQPKDPGSYDVTKVANNTLVEIIDSVGSAQIPGSLFDNVDVTREWVKLYELTQEHGTIVTADVVSEYRLAGVMSLVTAGTILASGSANEVVDPYTGELKYDISAEIASIGEQFIGFGNGITVEPTFDAFDHNDPANLEFLDRIDELADSITRSPPGTGEIVDVGDGLIKDIMDANGFIIGQLPDDFENTLPGKLIELRDSMVEARDFVYPTYATDGVNGPHAVLASAAALWVVDDFDKDPGDADRVNAGDNGRLLSAVQVSSQAINDQQKEDVRRTLFLFEEFYKSASGMLIKISQLIEKLAQASAR